METVVLPEVSVFAVLDQGSDSLADGVIVTVCGDKDSAEQYVRHRREAKDSADRLWRISEYPVSAALVLPEESEMLHVVYEEDAFGIRPLYLYASETLARHRVQSLASAEQVRLISDELTGAVSEPRSYWWECCPMYSLKVHQGGSYGSRSLYAA
jgi:hypothetical protein